jgi:pyruvate-formate lyase
LDNSGQDLDARDYSAIGCIEVAVPGKWGYRTTGMSFLNMMRVFLATINGGVDMKTGKTFHGGTGPLESFRSFDELMDAWREQLAYYTKASVGTANLGNSLAAITKFVYDEDSVTPKQLLAALESDFAGNEGELLRLRLLNQAPKYGNDDDYADSLVVESYGAYV